MKIILLLVFLSSCSMFRLTGAQNRRRITLECVNDFTYQEIDVYKAYKVCKDLYKKRYK